MARTAQTIYTYTDDLTGKEVEEAFLTQVEFSYGGKTYTIDLSQESTAKMDKALAPFIAKATPVAGGPGKVARRNSNAPKRSDNAEVRAWAIESGFTFMKGKEPKSVGKAGRIPTEVFTAYDAAH